MIFWSPDPAFWTDPGPVPHSGLVRRLSRARFATRPAWFDQYRRYYERLQKIQEEWEMYQQQLANHQAMLAEYEAQGQQMAEQLPYYLHRVRLSHWRKVQEKKSERYFDHIDYCSIEDWYFDEMAYYFWINTHDAGAFPYGLRVSDFLEPEVAETLSANFYAKTAIEYTLDREAERPGLWVIVEHRAGRGLVPTWVNYTDMIKSIPASAPPLVFPVGVGAKSRARFYDMDEVVTVLLAGQKGSGKSQKINVILCTWLQRATPQEVRLFLTDLKGGLELFDYNGVPHLGGDVDHTMKLSKDAQPEPVRLGQQVLEEPHQVAPMLKYMELEMARRQQIMKRARARKISAYNKRHKKNPLSRWVLAIDELATLADSNYSKECYGSLAELVRKGRAVGIYVILATQVPDKTVLTRQIAGNLDFRLVGYLSDGPSSGLALGDSSYDAVRLPPEVRGRTICRWNKKEVVQAPFISDMIIARIVAAAKTGQATTADEAEDAAMAQEIFTYALEELGGLCDYRELFKHFRHRIAQHKIKRVLKLYELTENGGELGPVIALNDDEYYLLPSLNTGNGKTSRELIDVVDFDRNRQKWLNSLELALGQEPRVTETPQTVPQRNSKPGRADPAKNLIIRQGDEV
jgi:hypothetical protein